MQIGGFNEALSTRSQRLQLPRRRVRGSVRRNAAYQRRALTEAPAQAAPGQTASMPAVQWQLQPGPHVPGEGHEMSIRVSIFYLRITWEPKIWLALGIDYSAIVVAVAGLVLRIGRRP